MSETAHEPVKRPAAHSVVARCSVAQRELLCTIPEQEDFLIRDNEGDLATCPETRGFATLMTLGGISSELSASGASDSDSSSVETTMPAMP